MSTSSSSTATEHADQGQVLDTYWPVIEAMRAVRAHYCGAEPRICSDPVCAAIEALNAAERRMFVVRSE